MRKLFLGGSRRSSRLTPDIRRRLDNYVHAGAAVVVGDANGADKAFQRYLRGKNYTNVEVFCSGHDCRNNVGDWKIRFVPALGRKRDSSFYSAKDQVMAEESDEGLMLWDGISAGTLANVARLVRLKKVAALYDTATKRIVEFHSEGDWREFLSRQGAELETEVITRAQADTVRSDLPDQMTFTLL